MSEEFILPKGVSSVFFIGIGGISMSSLACITHDRKIKTGGSDSTKSDMTIKLESLGIEVFYGHSADNVKGYDAVVYTAAIADDNPELVYARENGLLCIYRADYLGSLMKPYNNKIGVAGMHGKSTVTGMISHIFIETGENPTVLNGAITRELDGAFRVGGKDSFIFEACEYKDSFLSFYPDISVLLNLEMDHVDYFHSLEQIKDSFGKYMAKASKAIVNLNDGNLMDACKGYTGKLITYAVKNENADYNAVNIEHDKHGYPIFDIMKSGKKLCSVSLSIPGEHNIANTTAAIACADICGLDAQEAARSMRSFVGVLRRNEYKGETAGGVTVYDDYAHHPSEIRSSLDGLKKLCKKKLWCVYQPHTYSRTAGLFDEFTQSFNDADFIIFAEIYAAREKNTFGISSKDIADKIEGAMYIPVFEDIASYLLENAEKGDLIVTMGAGDIFKLHKMLLG